MAISLGDYQVCFENGGIALGMADLYCFRCGILGDETDRNKTAYRSGGFR